MRFLVEDLGEEYIQIRLEDGGKLIALIRLLTIDDAYAKVVSKGAPINECAFTLRNPLADL